MIHCILIGITLGWGAAIPIGPINIEIIRRNLQHGILAGLGLGTGACTADLTYLVTISYGMSTILTHTALLRIVSLLGAIILGWFGVQACRCSDSEPDDTLKNQNKNSVLKHFSQGYLFTLLNPYTILFWLSISSQITLYQYHVPNSLTWLGAGVLIGTLSWSITLNIVTHLIRHKFSTRSMSRLNKIGGIILLAFSALGILHSVTHL